MRLLKIMFDGWSWRRAPVGIVLAHAETAPRSAG
jgi:hypothetical protein